MRPVLSGAHHRIRHNVQGMTMQPTADAITPDQNGLRAGVPPVHQNGEGFAQEPGAAAADGSSLDLAQLLDALQAMRTGDFSVRLPGN
jgi:hypothetical protein